jgi:uncharacterized membrane protein
MSKVPIKSKTKQPNNLPKILSVKWFSILLICVGAVGLIASTMLTIDKIHVLKDPNFDPACNINPIFSCGSVMKTKQAEIAGVPNTLVGLVTFPVLITIGAMMLFGARMNRRFWQLFQLGVLGGLGMVIYLFFQGVYRINALCIYCVVTWVSVLPLVWYTTLYNLAQGNIVLPNKYRGVKDWAINHHGDIIMTIYLVLLVAILEHFWYFFGPYLGF